MKLFDDDFGVDKSPPDDTEITTTILYFSKEELALFKKLCKMGMRKAFPADYKERGNISDLLLKLLKENYADDKTEA